MAKNGISAIKYGLLISIFPIVTFAIQNPIGRMAIIGDAGQKGTSLENLKKSITKESLSSLILPGDNLYSGSYQSVWDDWKIEGFNFDVVAIGNHNESYAGEMAYFDLPSEYFSVVKFGARFIVLNSDNVFAVDKQMAWLEKEIDSASENLIFLVYHHPTFDVGSKHSWKEKRDFQLKMRQIFKTRGAKISAVFVGHDHISAFVDFGNVAAVVAGSGREVRPAKLVSYIEDGFQVETQFLAPENQHFAELDIDEGSASAMVHFINVRTNKVVCSGRVSHGPMVLDPNCKSN